MAAHRRQRAGHMLLQGGRARGRGAAGRARPGEHPGPHQQLPVPPRTNPRMLNEQRAGRAA